MKKYKENTYYIDNEKEIYFEPSFEKVETLHLVEISKNEVNEILKEKNQKQEPVNVDKVTMRQARLMLLNAKIENGEHKGKTYLDLVEEIIDSLPNTKEARQSWEYAQFVYIKNALVDILCKKLGIDEAKKQKLFNEASKIED